MSEDVVRELGHLTLGTRLKRLGDRLQGQTQAVLAEVGIDLPASHFPLLAALDRAGPLSVGALAQALGVSQPAVTRQLNLLADGGWVQCEAPVSDARVRTADLSRAGRQLVGRAKRVAWPRIEAAVAEACGGTSGSATARGEGSSLLARLGALEDALADQPLVKRAAGLSAVRAVRAVPTARATAGQGRNGKVGQGGA